MSTFISVIQPLKPKSDDWKEMFIPNVPGSAISTAWKHKEGFFVISSVERVIQEDGIDKGPEYHLSFSRQGVFGVTRVTSNQALWILDEFGCDGALEDNHVPFGKVRNFWRPVNDDLVGIQCKCVDDEPAIREDKGDYIWRP